MTVSQVLAAVVLAVCVLMLARMALPERLRWRIDTAGRRALSAGRRTLRRLRRAPAQRRSAARTAEEAIRRARRRAVETERSGNVIKPKSFQRPPEDG